MSNVQKITTFLWFNDNAEEAVDHYTSIFPNSKRLSVTRYTKAGPGPEGSVMVVTFQLAGQQFIALNGGPVFAFNEAISLSVSCETQAEADDLWEKLSAGGEPGQCGWLKDKFGLSWQIVPAVLPKLLQAGDPEQSHRVMEAMLQMTRLDIQQLQNAADGR